MTEQTGQRGEVETGTSSADDARAETSQDEADEMAGPGEQSGSEADAGSSGEGSGSSGSSGSGSGSGSESGSESSGASDSGSSGPSDSSDAGSAETASQTRSATATATEDRQESRPQHDHGEEGSGPRGRANRTPVDVGDLVWKTTNVVATLVRVVGYALAAVLVAHLVLVFVGVNRANGVAQVIGGVADVAVLAFRDLFLLGDPTFAVVVNNGLAAIFWVLVAEFGSRLVRWLGARLA